MVDYYSEVLKNDLIPTEKMDDINNKKDKKYLDIWKINPSYKDITTIESIFKSGFLISLCLFYFISFYVLLKSILFSIIFTSIFIIAFVLVFHQNFFRLRHLFKLRSYNPFSDISFWRLKDDESIIFYTNSMDLVTVGLRIFSVRIIPENIHANLNQFIKALNNVKVPFTYQLIQKPLDHKSQSKSRQLDRSSSRSYESIIYFSTYYDVKGILRYNKLIELIDKLNNYTNALKSNFAANFHHFNIEMLTGSKLIEGLRSSFLHQEIPIESENNNYFLKSTPKVVLLSKFLLSLFLLISIDLLLIYFKIVIPIRFFLNISIFGMIVLLWWRELLLYFIKMRYFKINDVEMIKPFSEISFFRVLRFPETIFFQFDKNIGGVKMVNLKIAIPPPICFPNKYYISLMKEQIPFTTTVISTPMYYYYFDKEGYKYLRQDEQEKLLKYIQNSGDEENWLSMRSGIWKTIMTLSTSCNQIVPSLNMEQILELELQLQSRISILKTGFEQNFNNFKIENLRKNRLESGMLCEILKNRFIHRNGTHLNYILFQGKTLFELIKIADEFKKGIETRIAAEFNTPLQLENFINIGHTINTEFLEKEIPAGLTLEQMHKLLITNGTVQSRELICMKIVEELIKAGYPSIIFDFTGNWSKLIKLFEGSVYEDNFLYYKLAKTFNMDPFNSDIAYDTENIRYIDYMFDAYALCFKKDDRTMEMFRNTIVRRSSENLSISSISLDLKTKPDWEKSPIDNTLISFFDEFTQQDLIFFQPREIKEEHKVRCYDFITNEKTIIIDLSQSKDFNKQCFFMLIILSKLLHYIKSGARYREKFFFLPHIDIIFDGFFLDKNIRYGKIDKFLSPLFQKGFGLICTCSQAHYLHPNIYNHFDNFITFKATDSRDVAVLSNQLSLEQLHGKGYYSKSRHEPYQIRYLKSMKKDEALMKRADIYQPFPIKIDIESINRIPSLEWDKIVDYMGHLGYDLEYTERILLEKAKKTIFEKDFGAYIMVIPEIVKFLENLKTVDKIGNLHINRIREELKKIIYPKFSKITKDKKRIKEMRDDLIHILVRHGYLVENHPRRASGSESLRASYSIGKQYEKALEDYYQSEKDTITNVSFDLIEANSDNLSDLNEFAKKESERQKNIELKFKNTVAKEMGETLNWDLFQMHRSINRKNFLNCIEIIKSYYKKFFYGLYKRLYNVNYAVTSADIEKLLEFIAKINEFPYTSDQLKELIDQSENILLEKGDPEQISNEMYKKCTEFFNQIQDYIYSAEE